MGRKRRRFLRLCVDPLEDRRLLSALNPPIGFTPSQIRSAYGIDTVAFSLSGLSYAGDGRGQTIAIVVAYHDPNLVSDLKAFDAGFGLPDPTLSQVNLGSDSNTDDGWAGEETLDVEWAHAIAPGASIVVVETASDGTADLLAGVNTARSIPGVNVVSMSWGGPEMANEAGYDSTFTTPSGHVGITFIAASGDTGTGGTQWPAASPNVMGVGGTTLVIDGANGYGGESAWSGAGSGLSRYEPRPSYQAGVQSTGRRAIPDVAFLGDPNTGVSVYTTNPSNGLGGWQVVGGTSLGAPAWAGIVAIIDEGLVLNGVGSVATVPLLNQFYALGTDFHAVSNAPGSSSRVSSTGLGTPDGQSLIADVVRLSIPSAQVSAPVEPPASPTPVAPANSGGSWAIFNGGGFAGTLPTTTTGKTRTKKTHVVRPTPKKPQPHPVKTSPRAKLAANGPFATFRPPIQSSRV